MNKNSNITIVSGSIPEVLFFATILYNIRGEKGIKMLISISIIKLIINLISWYYYFCSS